MEEAPHAGGALRGFSFLDGQRSGQWQRGHCRETRINESGIEQTVIAFDVILKMFRRVMEILAPSPSGAFFLELLGAIRTDLARKTQGTVFCMHHDT